MKTEEEIRQYLMQYKFKPNPNHFIIIDKWNNRAFKIHQHEIFDYISKCIDEMIIETCHNNKIFDVDDNEHMWYNTFNNWSWTKFENGVAVIKKERINDNR